ncbi:Zinc/iron permease [Podospora australis]|uniref:Zinc/iron permease n=1 Tax=Podospora australis TaxID=1536484 RepID=A0AAN6X458_9PEZI|nr:Zinc/iron permease [Podospora australis]
MAIMSRFQRGLLILAIATLAIFAQHAWAGKESGSGDVVDVGRLSLEEIGEELQQCEIVQRLNLAKSSHSDDASSSSFTSRLFAYLFPGSPAVNALLATLYISGPPNFLLALCPTDINPDSLQVMVAFAVGGLLGDTLFHLLPEIFLGEGEEGKASFVLVEPNRNLLLGVAILVGFLTFVGMDKGLRIATGGAGHSHDHSHGHGHGHTHGETRGESTAVEGKGEVTRRKGGKEEVVKVEEEKKEVNPSVKLGGLLNMIADFTHNITDGLAMSASFYASPTIGATTTVAVFFHEIPHEVGDFALLVQSGFSKKQAMGAQFVTAIGALMGTLIGIAVQEFGGNSAENGAGPMGMRDGIWGTSLTWGDMLLPFTAGTFLYVGTVAVIPELLETGPNKAAELRKTLVQFAAIAAGAGIMLYISWHE